MLGENSKNLPVNHSPAARDLRILLVFFQHPSCMVYQPINHKNSWSVAYILYIFGPDGPVLKRSSKVFCGSSFQKGYLFQKTTENAPHQTT